MVAELEAEYNIKRKGNTNREKPFYTCQKSKRLKIKVLNSKLDIWTCLEFSV